MDPTAEREHAEPTEVIEPTEVPKEGGVMGVFENLAKAVTGAAEQVMTSPEKPIEVEEPTEETPENPYAPKEAEGGRRRRHRRGSSKRARNAKGKKKVSAAKKSAKRRKSSSPRKTHRRRK